MSLNVGISVWEGRGNECKSIGHLLNPASLPAPSDGLPVVCYWCLRLGYPRCFGFGCPPPGPL